jgi:uncharacterized repeat protein (TIGR03803 family)
MKSKNVLCGLAIAVVWQLGMLAGSAQSGAVFTSLYSFGGTNDGVNDSANPYARLVQGSDGYFYGTTGLGGTNHAGAVFKITANGALTSLYSFTGGTDGQIPQGTLVQGSDGYFYGTTEYGGTNGQGTVFKMNTNGMLTKLYSFGTIPLDPSWPVAGLAQGSDGNFYGTTLFGGTNNLGTVFKISTNGVLASLYSFTGGSDGANPRTTVVQGSDGFFYGTTGGHGAFLEPSSVFKISTNGALTTLYTFSPPWFENPSALVQGGDGSFYGTTESGGTYGYGAMFKVSTNVALTNLYSFKSPANASQDGLGQGSDGSFYGTTQNGGNTNLNNGNGYGMVFSVTTNGTLTSLYSFVGTNDGANPQAGLVQGNDGNFYGTTQHGGTNNLGTVFRLTIQPPLTMTLSGANVILSWPTNYPDWYLQETVNLGVTGGWVSVTLIEPPIIVDGQFAVTLPITSPQQGYYRLSSP